MDQIGPCKHERDIGVDLNRQFAVDFGKMDESKSLHEDSDWGGNDQQSDDLCFNNYAGLKAFSEPESVAFSQILTQHKNELDFVINAHSNGNAFIYPFNGVEHNDIEKRRPGILSVFKDIVSHGQLPEGTVTGTSKQVMGITIGGDQDDWTVDTLGIPSVTSEIGRVD